MNIYNETKSTLDRALDYIHSSVGKEDLSVDDVASNVGFNSDYFNRLFSQYTGFSIMEYARFYRLRRGAYFLRTTDRDILDIALELGYSTHESFLRAFKKQYGFTPSEYREKFSKKIMTFADSWADVTAGARFADRNPGLRQIDRDTVIEYLLEKNTSRYGYDAITLEWNGSFVFTNDCVDEGVSDSDVLTANGNYLSIDCFNDRSIFQLHLRDKEKLPEYMDFVDEENGQKSFGIVFEEDLEEDGIRRLIECSPYAIKELRAIPAGVYFGEMPEIPEIPNGYSVRELTESDIPAVQKWGEKRNVKYGPSDWGLSKSLSFKDEIRSDKTLGLFLGDDLIGATRLAFQETHGFRLNNCICTVLLEDHKTPEFYRLMYLYGMKFALDAGVLLYDDSQFGEFAANNGGFTAEDMGYAIVNTIWSVTVERK